MRHRVFGRKLGRDRDHRKALFKNLVASLIIHEQIKTTEAKAKSVKGLVDKIITKGKMGGLHAQRNLIGFFANRQVVDKVVKVLTPRFKQRTSGFTRIVRLGKRKGDQASIVRLELVDKKIIEKKKRTEKKVQEKETVSPPIVEGEDKTEEKKKEAAVSAVPEEREGKGLSLKQSLRPRMPSFIKRPPKKGQ